MFRYLLPLLAAPFLVITACLAQPCTIVWMRGSHLGPVDGVTFLAGDDTLVSASEDGTIKFWDVESGRLLRSIPIESGATSLSLSLDESLAAVVDRTGRTLVFSTPEWRSILAVTRPEARATCARISHDGMRLAVGFSDGQARLYSVPVGEMLTTFSGSKSMINAIDVSGDNSVVATTAADYTTRIYEASNGTQLQLMQEVQYSCGALEFSPDSRLIAALGYDSLAYEADLGRYRGIVLFDVATGENRRPLHHWFWKPIASIAWSRDGRYVASAAQDFGKVRYKDGTSIDVSDLTGVKSEFLFLQEREHAWPTALAISPAAKHLGWGCSSGAIRIAPFASETAPGIIDSTIRTFTTHNGGVSALALSSDAELLASADTLGQIRLWRAADGTPVAARADAHSMAVTALAHSRDGAELASSSVDGSVKIWRTDRLEALSTIVLSADYPVVAVAFGAHRRIYAALGFGDSVVVRVDSGSQRPSARYVLPGGEITAMAVALDESRIAAGSRSGVLRVWDLASGTMISERSFDAPVISASFAADNPELLIVGTDDGSLHLTESSTGSTLDAVRRGGATIAISTSAFGAGSYVAASGRDSIVAIYRIGPETLIEVGRAEGYPARHRSVVLDAPHQRLFTGASDASVIDWQLDASTGAPAAEALHRSSLGRPVPHPAREVSVVRFSVAKDGFVRLALYDLPGRRIAVLADGVMERGEHVAHMPVKKLSPGSYLLRLESSGTVLGRVVVVQ